MSFDALWDAADEGPGDPTKPQASQPVQPKPPVGAFDALWDQAPAPTPQRSGVYNAINTVDNALTFGLGQKFNAAVNAAGDAIRGRDSFGHSYTQNLNAEHAGLQQFAAQHPYGSAALSAAGAAGGILAAAPFAAAGEVARGTSLAQRALGAAKTGGALGSIAALGNAPNIGGFGRQLATAGAGGAIGAGLGAGSVSAAEAIAQAAQKLQSPLSRVMQRAPLVDDAMSSPAAQSIPPEAAETAMGHQSDPRRLYAPSMAPSTMVGQSVDRPSEILIHRMQRAGMTPADAIAQVAKIPADKPVTVMELPGDKSHPVVQLGKLVARTPSTGAADMRDQIAQRMDPMRGGMSNAQRVLGDASNAMGVERTNMVTQGQKLITDRSSAASPLYAAAMQSPPVPLAAKVVTEDGSEGPALGALLKRPSMQKAVGFHNDVAAERGDSPLVLPGAQGTIDEQLAKAKELYPGVNEDALRTAIEAQQQSGAGVPMNTLHRIKLKLDDMIGYAKSNGEFPDGTAATRDKLRAVQDTKNALLQIMDQHSGAYQQARNIFAGHSALVDASEVGRGFLSTPIDELRSNLAAMTPGESEQYKISALSGPVRDKIFKSPGADLAKTITSTPDLHERLQVIVPDPKELASFLDNLKYERAIAKTNQTITGGSDTFENALNSADAAGSLAHGVVASGVRHGIHGVASTLFNNALESGMARMLQGVTEGNANALAPKLTAGMSSRADLVKMLQDLADQHALMMRGRVTPPLLGANAGATFGKLPGQNY